MKTVYPYLEIRILQLKDQIKFKKNHLKKTEFIHPAAHLSWKMSIDSKTKELDELENVLELIKFNYDNEK